MAIVRSRARAFGQRPLGASLLLVALVGCGPSRAPAATSRLAASPPSTRVWTTTLDRDHPLVGRVWNVRKRRFVEERELLGLVQRAHGYVLLGEKPLAYGNDAEKMPYRIVAARDGTRLDYDPKIPVGHRPRCPPARWRRSLPVSVTRSSSARRTPSTRSTALRT